jgi:hypothetical protein
VLAAVGPAVPDAPAPRVPEAQPPVAAAPAPVGRRPDASRLQFPPTPRRR